MADRDHTKVISEYISECRKRADRLSKDRFSLSDSWRIQKKFLLRDLAVTPINSAWSLPYLAIKKTLEILDKLGMTWAAKAASRIPSGIRTGYQKEMEYLICKEVLAWNLYQRPNQLPEPIEKAIPGNHARTIKNLVDQFSTSRALVSDLSSTGLTLLLGKVLFGNTALDLQSMAYLFAKKKAHDEAASNFFLGKGIGSAFYDVFPASVNVADVRAFFVALLIALTVMGMICTLLSDPIRKKLGLHEKRLHTLLNDMEKELLYLAHRNRN